MALKQTALKISTLRKNSSQDKKMEAAVETFTLLRESLYTQKLTLIESVARQSSADEDDVYSLNSMLDETVKNLNIVDRCLNKLNTEM